MPTIYLLTCERLGETAEAGVLHTIRTNARTIVRICASKQDALHVDHGGSSFVAFLLREFTDDSIVSFHFLTDDSDVLHRLAHDFLDAVGQNDAATAHLIHSVAPLVVRHAVQSAQALVGPVSASTRCRHVVEQVATHLLKLGIHRTSPPYDLVAAIALDMFLRGETIASIEHLQEAIRASGTSTVKPLRHRAFKRVVVHTDLSFHQKAKEADIDDQHAVVYVLSKSLGEDTDPWPNGAIDIVLSARHKDADIGEGEDGGPSVPLTTPASVLELVRDQVARFGWEITAELSHAVVVWSRARQRALTIRVHSESLDDNRELEEALLGAFQRERERFVTLLIGPVTPALARLYASCSRVISGTSVDEGVNSGVASRDPRLMGGLLLPKLCVAHPMYDLARDQADTADTADDDRPVLMNLKPNVSRFLYTPSNIIRHPDVIMAQYEYALKTVSRPYWRCGSSSMEVRLAYSNGLTTPREGPIAVVERLRQYIERRSDVSTVLADYRVQHPIDTDGPIVECAMQHAAAVVSNALTEFDTSDATRALRERYAAFIHDGSASDFGQLYEASRGDEWSHATPNAPIVAMVRAQMPDATPTSIACLLRCMLALFLHRFVQVEYARVASGLPNGGLVTFRRALPHPTVADDDHSAVHYRLDGPCRVGECRTITLP